MTTKFLRMESMMPCRLQGKYLPNDSNFASKDTIDWSTRKMDMLSPGARRIKSQEAIESPHHLHRSAQCMADGGLRMFVGRLSVLPCSQLLTDMFGTKGEAVFQSTAEDIRGRGRVRNPLTMRHDDYAHDAQKRRLQDRQASPHTQFVRYGSVSGLAGWRAGRTFRVWD